MAERAPRKTARARPAPAPTPPDDSQDKALPSGFATIREVLSYVLGAVVLVYGVTFASPDRAYLVVGAGLALLGSPIVGTIFDKKEK